MRTEEVNVFRVQRLAQPLDDFTQEWFSFRFGNLHGNLSVVGSRTDSFASLMSAA